MVSEFEIEECLSSDNMTDLMRNRYLTGEAAGG